MPIKQEGEENAKSKATRKASSRGLSLVLHTIQDKEGKEDKYGKLEPDMVDYPGRGRFSLCLPLFVQLVYQRIRRFREKRDAVADPAI